MFDIAVIGAGPAGLFSLFEAGMLGLKGCVIDALEDIGGQCSALYPQKPIYDIPGCPKILAHELIERLQDQAAPFRHQVFCNQTAISLKKKADHFEIITLTGDKISTKTVVIAAGGGAFGPNKPPIEGIEKFEGKSIFYMVKNPEIFKKKRVVIAGGGDSALDWAIVIADIADKTYLVHRRDKFRAAPESLKKLELLIQQKKVELVVPYQLKSLKDGADGSIESVIVADMDDNIKSIEADYLLPFFGLSMDLGPISEWGLEVEKKHIKVNPATMETNVQGVFAIGDIAIYPGKLKLILTGFAEAALACHSAYALVHPDIPLHFEYSTTKGIPT